MNYGAFFRKRLHAVITAAAVMSFILPPAATGQVSSSSVLMDRADKQNIIGTTEIAFAWGQQLEPPQDLRRGVINLMEAMNAWTKVQTRLDRNLMLSDKRIMDIPFVFITADQRFELTQTEIDNLREYIDNGGFIFLDNAQPVSDMSQSGAMLKKMIRQVIPNARFEILLNASGIYHSFFDFNDGPPLGSEIGTFPDRPYAYVGMYSPDANNISVQRLYLEGVRYKGRLVAVYSDKGYIHNWTEGGADADPQLKMGINLIIYALTQEGSIATQAWR